MLIDYFPLIAATLCCIMAQFLKPFVYLLIEGKWKPKLFFANGSMPSSHSSLVSGLSMAILIKDGISSSVFAISLAFACIVCFDAANVRWYAGQNISLTQKLIDDLKELSELPLNFDDPIYSKKMKDVLGHTYMEVAGGVILGVLFTLLLSMFFV